jgi:hypothetical protein
MWGISGNLGNNLKHHVAFIVIISNLIGDHELFLENRKHL